MSSPLGLAGCRLIFGLMMMMVMMRMIRMMMRMRRTTTIFDARATKEEGAQILNKTKKKL